MNTKFKTVLSRPAVWQWGIVAAGAAAANGLAAMIDPASFVVKMLYGAGTMFCAWAGPAYFIKASRYRVDLWKGKGMIRRDMDSGAKEAARIYLDKERPSFWCAPLSHFILKWTYTVGEIDIKTGSVSVTKVFVTNLVTEEKQCRSIGTNDVVKGAAAAHVCDLAARLRGGENSIKEHQILVTIDGLVNSCLKIKEDMP